MSYLLVLLQYIVSRHFNVMALQVGLSLWINAASPTIKSLSSLLARRKIFHARPAREYYSRDRLFGDVLVMPPSFAPHSRLRRAWLALRLVQETLEQPCRKSEGSGIDAAQLSSYVLCWPRGHRLPSKRRWVLYHTNAGLRGPPAPARSTTPLQPREAIGTGQASARRRRMHPTRGRDGRCSRRAGKGGVASRLLR